MPDDFGPEMRMVPTKFLDILLSSATECAEDLALGIEREYKSTLHYPTMKRRYDRDMAPVILLRQAIDAIKDCP